MSFKSDRLPPKVRANCGYARHTFPCIHYTARDCNQRRERMKKQRKHYTPEEKVAILRRHLLEEEPSSKLCDDLGLQPTVFYRSKRNSSRTGPQPSSRSATESLSRTGADRVPGEEDPAEGR